MQDINSICRTLKSWSRNTNRLNQRVLLEMPRFRNRWGFFVLLLKIADPKTGWIEISVKDLVTLTGAVRNNIYTVLRSMERAGYIRYIPAKNGRRRHVSIQVLGMEKYIAGRKNGVLSINKNKEEMLEAQRDLLLYNPGYRNEMAGVIKRLFREKLKTEIPEDIIYGKTNSLLERFMADDIVRYIKRLDWGEKIRENPIGHLILSLESGVSV